MIRLNYGEMSTKDIARIAIEQVMRQTKEAVELGRRLREVDCENQFFY